MTLPDRLQKRMRCLAFDGWQSSVREEQQEKEQHVSITVSYIRKNLERICLQSWEGGELYNNNKASKQTKTLVSIEIWK